MIEKTLESSKQFLRANWRQGCDCPCCGQFVKLYKRKLTSSMGYALILIKQAGRSDFFHIENYLKTLDISAAVRGDFPKLRFWGFITPKSESREDGSPRNGYYRITEEGRRFAMGLYEVPKHVFLFNNKSYGFSDEKVSIRGVLGQKFRYDELMGRQ